MVIESPVYHKACYTSAMVSADPSLPGSAAGSIERVERCDLCGGGEQTLLARWTDNIVGDSTWNVMRCKGCGLSFLSPRPSPEAIGRFYPDAAGYLPYRRPPVHVGGLARRIGARDAAAPGLFTRALIGIRQDYAWFEIPRWQGEGRILDVGCASGAFLDVMRELGWDTYGVEFNPAAAEIARERGHQVAVGSADVDHHPAGTFDVVYMWHALEHTYAPSRTLAMCHRMLKPGGTLMLAVPNVNAIQRRIWGTSWAATEVPRHLYHFSRSSLRRYLTDAGFTDVDVRTRTGAVVSVRSLRYLANRVLKTKWERDPGWMVALNEAPTMIGNVFGFFGLGSELRVRCRKST